MRSLSSLHRVRHVGAAFPRQRRGDGELVRSMSAMAGMEMPGGWTMSMAWMRMPGQSGPGAAATFPGMWTVMMVTMAADAGTDA